MQIKSNQTMWTERFHDSQTLNVSVNQKKQSSETTSLCKVNCGVLRFNRHRRNPLSTVKRFLLAKQFVQSSLTHLTYRCRILTHLCRKVPQLHRKVLHSVTEKCCTQCGKVLHSFCGSQMEVML